MQLYMMVSL